MVDGSTLCRQSSHRRLLNSFQSSFRYWIVDAVNRQVESYSNPQPTAAGLRYSDCQRIQPGASIAVIVAGQAIGNLPAAGLLHAVA